MNGKHVGRYVRWLIRGIALGVVVGAAMWLLTTAIVKISGLRSAHVSLQMALPLGAIITAWLYQTLGPYLRSGTAQVIEIINHGLIALVSPTSAHDDEKTAENISAKMVPLLYLSTMISHLVGASTGKEGAGVQIGASVGNYVARLEDVLLPKHLEHHDPTDTGIWMICGAGAAFGALFNAPVAGTLFGLQFSSPQVNRSEAFIPSLMASFTACFISKNLLGIATLSPTPSQEVTLTPMVFVTLFLLAVAMGLFSMLFIFLAGGYRAWLSKRFTSVWTRTLFSSVLLLAFSFLFAEIIGDWRLNGLSSALIGTQVAWYIPLGKMLLTVLSIGSGFVGGEVIPIMVLGSTASSLFSGLAELPLSAITCFGALGMLSAATKLPLACFMLGLEIFGFANPEALFFVCMVSYSVSGMKGIYEKQGTLFHFTAHGVA
ncbi:MAG: chloride channel protein [Sphaerochaeta sp.]|jgi:H+/Cl- antiporter ClcA|nr:chloride channel protein [Sphaerochaeta sp.]MCI2096684.1 chloride channel protein [Sphaerochaeta sp.]